MKLFVKPLTQALAGLGLVTVGQAMYSFIPFDLELFVVTSDEFGLGELEP